MARKTSGDVVAQRILLMAEMHSLDATFAELGRHLAASLETHHTDAVALLEIVEAERRDEPLSPARLGERVALTSGATTALVNRLERAHHVVRVREQADRRVVSLHATEHVRGLAEQYFGPLGDRLDEMMSQYPAEQRRQFIDFMVDLRTTLEHHLREQDSEVRPTQSPSV
ncbi:MarR family transcriptional regulator [Mycobacterium sp. NPDC050853]|uniref:MarR family winged helix-turn-helix transcriptional regulator n=1 Tax=Mycobacterium sp. NPDC050853 TaxID=3155160 RepID=UPI0033F14CD7